MKLKLLSVISLVAMLAATPLYAVEENEQVTKEKKVKEYYVNNGFWDNWFLGLDLGATWNADGLLSKEAAANFTPVINVTAGKWFNPYFGARIGWSGWGLQNKTVADKWMAFNYIHGDILWNWVNQFGGYKADRLYNISPYLHAGVLVNGENGREFAMGAGLLNQFRITDNWKIHIDLRSTFFNGSAAGTVQGVAATLDLMVGFSYNFNKATWDVASTNNNDELLKELQEKNQLLSDKNDELANACDRMQTAKEKLADENEILKEQLKNAKTDTVVINNNDKQVDLNAASTVYYGYGKSDLTNVEQTRLDNFIENVVKPDAKHNNKYEVTGYADKSTGSEAANKIISGARAAFVKNVLVNAGVPSDNIEVIAGGGIEGDADLCRSAIITVK